MKKVNRTRSIAKRNMKRAGNTSNRPEQMLAKKIIKKLYPSSNVETEWKVHDIKPAGGLDLTGKRMPRLDIAILPDRIGIRLQGPPHDEKNQERYDFRQKEVLEHPINGWKIVDFGYREMPNLWKLDEHDGEVDIRVVLAAGLRKTKLS